MKIFTRSTAHFSRDRKYRYKLERVWDPSKALVMFIGLNPSTADEEKNDPTIHKCMRYATQWGFGGIVMTNLFAYVATHPSEMKLASEPVGEDNDDYILGCLRHVDKTIAVWSDHGTWLGRDLSLKPKLTQLHHQLHYLKLSRAGNPRHPLFLTEDLDPQLWNT